MAYALARFERDNFVSGEEAEQRVKQNDLPQYLFFGR